MITFREEVENFIKRLTFEKFQEFYKHITSLFSSPFYPDEKALEYYYLFIKEIKFNFNGNSLNVVVAPRESYKTLTFSKVFPIMLLLNSIKKFDDLSVIVLGSYLAKDVKVNIYNDWQNAISKVKNIYLETKNIRETIFTAKSAKEKMKRVLLKTIASKSTLRSTNLAGRRVQLLVLDDIDQPRADRTFTSREYSVIRFTSDWLPSIENGNSLIIVAGNLEHKVSIINYLLNQEKVNKLVLPCKINGEYIKKSWDEEWEENMRQMLGDSEFERLYYHKLKEANLFEGEEDEVITESKAFIDVGINERSMAMVIISKNTIIETFKGSLSEFLNEGVEIIKLYKPQEIYYEKNGLQDNFMKQIISSYLIDFKDRIRGIVSNTSKEERLALTILNLRNKNIKVRTSCLEDIQEEIDIYETGGNPHILDAVSFYVLKYLKEEPYLEVK